jgi:hypothetical protein
MRKGDSSFIPHTRDSFGMTGTIFESGEEVAIRHYSYDLDHKPSANRHFFPLYSINTLSFRAKAQSEAKGK